MKTHTLRHLRHLACQRQHGRCFYCGLLMWERRPDEVMRRYGISARLASTLQCTAEHLVARCEGGADTRSNIVAACGLCNHRRHKGRSKSAPQWAPYKQRVDKRMAAGKWHPVKRAAQA